MRQFKSKKEAESKNFQEQMSDEERFDSMRKLFHSEGLTQEQLLRDGEKVALFNGSHNVQAERHPLFFVLFNDEIFLADKLPRRQAKSLEEFKANLPKFTNLL